MRQQNLFQILKLSSTFIVENNLDIQNYTKKKAAESGCIVSVGDNIAFDQIRRLRGDRRTPEEIFNETQFLRKALRECKARGQEKEGRAIGRKLNDLLFVEEIISVEAKSKSEYKKLAKAGFYVNGKRYVRFSAGAGQIRRNTAFFIYDKIYPTIFKILMCGLDQKIKEINLAKLSAYFALSTSSVMWVRTPRVCVVKDFETVIKNQKIDWVVRREDGSEYIEERTMDVPLNSADGQGLISPKMASLWAEDMKLDYTPSSFVVRTSYVKGNLVPFDFKEYARRNNITKIFDKWGYSYPIEDIDVILSESQFKMHKYYSSWQEYLSYTEPHGIHWGVARYNRKFDEEYSLVNYQYIQVLKLTEEEICSLISPTVEWIKQVCTGNPLYALLYSFGKFGKGEDVDYNEVAVRAQNLAMKAVVKDSSFLKDTYVQKKIYKNIIESINRAKIGKIWVCGNYQFCISDPIAQCRSALGLEPKGEVPANNVWCNFWNERGISGTVDICRSPMIDQHEHNPSNLYQSDEANYWYQYIKSGCVFSIYDTAVCRMEDSDFDGDICLLTNNSYFVKGSNKNLNCIMYDKQTAPSHKISHSNFVKIDLAGFGTKVGNFSNTATIIEAMRPLFAKPGQEYQYNELLYRKKLLREIVGNEIDAGKGLKHPVLPPEWKKFERINPDDDDATKAEKYRHNSLVVSKKPYFFRYLYPELNKKYKQYENAYNEISKCMYGIKFKKLLAKPDKTEEEKTLVRRYHKFSPLINSDCTINILCREFESVDFDIQYNKENISMLPWLDDYECSEEVLKEFRKMYQKYSNKRSLSYINYIYDGQPDEDYKEIRFSIMDAIRDEIQEEYAELELKPLEALTYIRRLSEGYKKFNWDFAWDLLGESILDCIETKEALIPIEDENGEEYLGKKYSLAFVSKDRKNFEINPETGEVIWNDNECNL